MISWANHIPDKYIRIKFDRKSTALFVQTPWKTQQPSWVQRKPFFSYILAFVMVQKSGHYIYRYKCICTHVNTRGLAICLCHPLETIPSAALARVFAIQILGICYIHFHIVQCLSLFRCSCTSQDLQCRVAYQISFVACNLVRQLFLQKYTCRVFV